MIILSHTQRHSSKQTMRTFILVAVVACALSADAQILVNPGETQFGPNAAAGLAVTNYGGGQTQLLAVSLNTSFVDVTPLLYVRMFLTQ